MASINSAPGQIIIKSDRLKNYFILSLFFILSACLRDNNCSNDLPLGESYSGKGYLLYFRTSQDGMGDFWFFPACLESSQLNRIDGDELFFDAKHKIGVSFKLPLSGSQYTHIKRHFHPIELDSLSFFTEVWITPIEISFEKTEMTLHHYPSMEKILKLKLIRNKKIQILSYIQINDINIRMLEIPDEK